MSKLLQKKKKKLVQLAFNPFQTALPKPQTQLLVQRPKTCVTAIHICEIIFGANRIDNKLRIFLINCGFL